MAKEIKEAPIQKGITRRNPFLYIGLGGKGTGKSFTTNKKVLIPYAYGKHPKKVLIIDINSEYTDYKTIAFKDIELFSVHPKNEVRRYVPPPRMSLDEISETVLQIVKKYNNGLLLIEDITAYVSDHLPSDLIGSIIRLRHSSCDIVLHFQNVGKLGHPKILGNTNVVRLHRTTDDVERHKSKFEEHYTIMKLAQTIVFNDFRKATTNEAEKDILGTWVDLGGGNMEYKSAYVYVSLDKNRLSGNFRKEHFFEAVQDFINDNEKTTINPILNRKNKKGKKIFTYEQALNECIDTFYKDFYGNPDR